MLYFASLLTVVTSAAIVATGLKDFKHRFGKCTFFAAYGLIFGLAPMMQSSIAYVNEFGPAARTEAAYYSLAGLLMLFVGFSLTEWPASRLAVHAAALRQRLVLPPNQRLLEYIFAASIVITAVAQLLLMYAKGITVGDLLAGGRFEYRFNDRGFGSVLAVHLTSFAYVPAFVGVFLNRRYRLLTYLYVLIASGVFYFIFSKGTRSIPLSLAMTLLVAFSIRYRFTARHVLYAGAAAVAFLALAIGLSETRQHLNSMSWFDGLKLLLSAETYQQMWDRDPLNYGTNLVGAIAVFPQDYPYLCGATYRRMPVFFLRESQFPDLKPPDTNVLFGLIVHNRPQELEVTAPPSILGDVYINFWGWWGLPFLCLHGILYGWLLRIMRTHLFGFLWVGPLSGRFLTLIHRGEPYEMFVLFVMFMAMMGGVYCVCRWLCRLTASIGPAIQPAPYFARRSSMSPCVQRRFGSSPRATPGVTTFPLPAE
jgi:hypothetical protein